MARFLTLGKDTWDPSNRFETSWLLPPWLLGVCRALISIFQFTVLLFNIGWYCTHPSLGGCYQSAASFSFFTVLTYWGLAFYFLASAIHTLSYAATGSAPLDRLPRPLQALHSVLYTTAVAYPFIVTVVYWAVLFPSVDGGLATPFDAFRDVSEHALNSGFALFEILVPRTALPPWAHVAWLIAILALYLALAYVTRATKGFYTYSFLDPGKSGGGAVAGYVFGIAAGCVVVYLIVKGAVWLRLWVTEEKWGMRGMMSGKAGWRRRGGPPDAGADVEMTATGQAGWEEGGRKEGENGRRV